MKYVILRCSNQLELLIELWEDKNANTTAIIGYDITLEELKEEMNRLRNRKYSTDEMHRGWMFTY